MTRYSAFESQSDEDEPRTSSIHPFAQYRTVAAGPSSSYRPHTSRSALGKRSQSYAAPSDSDPDDDEVDRAMDSEDEVLLDLDSNSEKGRPHGTRRMSRTSSLAQSSVSRSHSHSYAPALHFNLSPRTAKGKARESFKAMLQIAESEPNEYEAWVRITEEAAWREGHKIAHSRRAELREIALNARAEMREEQSMQAAQDAEEMRRLLEGLALDQSREEEEARRVFKEREKKLWADIDAAIKRTEELEAQRRALEAAAQKKAADAETARKQAADKAAADAREQTERIAREAAEKKRADELAKAQAVQAAEQRREEEAAKKKAAEARGATGAEWRHWVEKQKDIKAEVIERVKADKAVKLGLKQGMRLITRGLGQVVNTRESVVRVTEDIAGILSAQLPSPPTAATPTLLSNPLPQPYSYLLSHTSKALIKQAESEVSAKQDAAFPLARIVLGLMLRGHAALGEVLFARFVKKCPWVVPFWPSRRADQPRAEYEKSTGRGSDESVTDYTSRMAGIATLYFAILQTPLASLIPTLPASTPPPTPDQLVILVPPVLRLPAAWTWLAHALRDAMPALPPVAHLVANWIEVCGFEVARVYGSLQIGKVYESIRNEGIKEGKIKGDSEASRQRLGILLEGNPGRESSGRNWQ